MPTRRDTLTELHRFGAGERGGPVCELERVVHAELPHYSGGYLGDVAVADVYLHRRRVQC